VAVFQHGTSVLITSHPKDGLVVNLYIPHNRRTPLQAEEALGPISIPRGSRGVDPFQRTSASRAEKPGAYSTPGTPSGRGPIFNLLFQRIQKMSFSVCLKLSCQYIIQEFPLLYETIQEYFSKIILISDFLCLFIIIF
jgi:hypothetical protein